MPRRPELDGLRGVAAWVVVLSHVSNETGLWDKAFGLGGGQLGVMLFFILSGYLMGALYLDRPFDLANVREYGVRRIARVLPLYYGLVILSFALTTTVGIAPYAITPDNVLAHLGLISGISVLWTIPIEIQFYGLFVILWALYRRSPSSLIVATIAALIAFFLVQQSSIKYVPGTLTFYVAYFLSGMLVSRLPQLDLPPRHWSILFVTLLATFVLVYPGIYLFLFNENRWPYQVFVMQMWHDPIYLVCGTGILVTTLYAPLAKIALGHRFMQFNGAISYSIYLLHVPIILLIKWTGWLSGHPVLFLIATVLTTTLVASASFRFVERPAGQWIRSRWEDKRRIGALAPNESAR